MDSRAGRPGVAGGIVSASAVAGEAAGTGSVSVRQAAQETQATTVGRHNGSNEISHKLYADLAGREEESGMSVETLTGIGTGRTKPHGAKMTAPKVTANGEYEAACGDARRRRYSRPSMAFFERKHGLKPNQLKYYRANRLRRKTPEPEPDYMLP